MSAAEVVLSAGVAAAAVHDIAFSKSCTSPTSIGDPYVCSYLVSNTADTAGDTLRITSLTDVIGAKDGDVTSGNLLSLAQLVLTGGATCVGGTGSGTIANPYVGATECQLPSGASVEVRPTSHYTVQASDYTLANHVLPDTATLTWNNLCAVDPDSDCTTTSQTATATGSTTVRQLTATVVTHIHDAAHQVVTSVALGSTVHDFVTVTGAASSAVPSGYVSIDYFSNGNCTGTATSSASSLGPLAGDGQLDATGFSVTVSSGPAGSFLVHYLGDATYGSSVAPCEALTVTDSRPVVTVTKACPSGKQNVDDRFAVFNNGTSTGAVLDCGDHVDLRIEPATAFQITEQAGSSTTSLAAYDISYTGCAGSGLATGATVTCTITNTLTPLAQPQTMGYWKNHPATAAGLLPVQLGTFSVATTQTAAAVLNGANCGSSTPQNAVSCLAAQLLASKLNVKNGSSTCVLPTVSEADTLLATLGYAGPGQPLPKPSKTQRRELVALKSALDRYNSGGGC